MTMNNYPNQIQETDRYKTLDFYSMTYSFVLYSDYMRIMLLIVTLNELYLKGIDFQNPFLSVTNLENNRLKPGSEFGTE